MRGARRNLRILEDGRVKRCEEAMILLVLAAEVGMVVSEAGDEYDVRLLLGFQKLASLRVTLRIESNDVHCLFVHS